MDLAVAIVVGSSFTALVNALVADFITPTIGIAFDPDSVFGDLTFQINGSVFRCQSGAWLCPATVRGSRTSSLTPTFPLLPPQADGHFLNILLTFMLVCFILYFVVVLPTNKLMALVAGAIAAHVAAFVAFAAAGHTSHAKILLLFPPSMEQAPRRRVRALSAAATCPSRPAAASGAASRWSRCCRRRPPPPRAPRSGWGPQVARCCRALAGAVDAGCAAKPCLRCTDQQPVLSLLPY